MTKQNKQSTEAAVRDIHRSKPNIAWERDKP